jgi:hypothetical protein
MPFEFFLLPSPLPALFPLSFHHLYPQLRSPCTGNALCECGFASNVNMTDQTPPGHSPEGSLRVSPGTKAYLVQYIESPGSPSLPLSIYQRRPARRPPLRVDTESLDHATSPFALLT